MLLDDDGVKLRKAGNPFPVIRIATGAALGCVLMFLLLMHQEQPDESAPRVARQIERPVPPQTNVAQLPLV
ncbi:hypothetical protein [Rhizobium halophytocola]|uniref:Energy transducer TonB n=1 Tax=Rhizobium halophytocola TaxID=735519 RepID=A0ABS4E3W5_9HYPH|nr:hypothetical protein [Rhizobium halophytocola]MBP1852633.1 hypothetical protein [Rhizobium halophytocola]